MFVEMTEFGEDRKEIIRIDPHDTWNMCDDLALIILPMLKQLKATKHGSPDSDDEDVPEHLRSINGNKENDYLVHDRWNWIMDEMIWAFEQIIDRDSENQFFTGNIEFVSEPYAFDDNDEPTLFSLKPGPNHTSVYDREGHTRHYERVRRGTTLFGKYYQGLWD